MSFPERNTRKAHYLLFASVLLVSAACSETATDAVEGVCWPIDTAVASGGNIQIGSGFGEFSVFESGQDVLVEAGAQGGYHIRVALHIEGLNPGDADNILSKDNPRTRLNLVDQDGESISNSTCPMRIPYGDKGDGLELLRSYSMIFPLERNVIDLYNNQPITLRAEIIDSDGNFAITERQVIARFPEQPPTIGSSISNTPEVMASPL